MKRLAVLLVPVAFNACRCEPENPSAIAPQIFVDVCDSPEKVVAGELIGGFEECGVAFGDRDISVRITQAIRVTNPSIVELVITEVELVGDPAFQLDVVPETIGVGLADDIIISVRPSVQSTITGTLIIHSNAQNTELVDGESIVEIPLSLNGVDNGIPDIEVLPGDCDFGRVPVGGVDVCNVTITNLGSRPLVVDSVKWVPVDGAAPDALFDVPAASGVEVGAACNDGASGCPFAFTGAPPGADEEIAQGGGTVVMPVRFTPDVLGNFQGRFEIASSDPDESLIAVATSGVSVTPPTCGLRVKSVNGQDLDLLVEPLDNVILSTDASDPSTPEGRIVSQEWIVSHRPAGSRVELTSSTEADVGFSFNNGGNLGVDLAGEYCVTAQVFDDLAVGSVNECSLCFEAIPKDNFLVQLSWDTNSTDMDLHVTKESPTAGEFCIDSINGSIGANALHTSECDSGLDCNWLSGCKATGAGQEWDGVAGRGEGDPSLDIDDTSGFGPENINVDAMSPGNYVIGVNAYGGASGSTVRVFIFGRLVGEFFHDITPQEWWEVALVRWPDGVTTTLPCVEDLTDGTSGDQLAVCDAFEAAP